MRISFDTLSTIPTYVDRSCLLDSLLRHTFLSLITSHLTQLAAEDVSIIEGGYQLVGWCLHTLPVNRT